MTFPLFTPLVSGLPSTVPFVGPEEQERRHGQCFAARLGANENGFGPSPRAMSAMQVAIQEIWKYGDSTNQALIARLVERCKVGEQNVVVGEGIDGLLGYLVRLFVAPGTAVVMSDGAYPTFAYHVAGYGGVLHKVPYRDDHEDPDALIARAREVGARLIYLANPDNPMGTWHDAARVQAMCDALPEGCLLVLDEAYIEFAPQGTAADIAADDPRVIRMRTFSKAYGMAGARIGYALGAPELIRAFDKVRNHFGVNRVAQAGALAALADVEWLEAVRLEVLSARRDIGKIAARHGLRALPSATNFVAIDCGGDGAFARRVLAGLIDLGVFVRMPAIAPLDRCIRVSCGPTNDLTLFDRALGEVLRTLRATDT